MSNPPDSQPPAKAKLGELPLRIFSALVLGPLVLAAVLLGGVPFEILLCIGALIGVQEWVRLAQPLGHARLMRLMLATTIIILAETLWIGPLAGLAMLLLATLSVTLAAMIWRAPNPLRLACGLPYVLCGMLAMLWLRALPETGQFLLIYIMLVTWATDIGAYVAGRVIGGPKLAPRISPKKTWAGLGGAMASAAAVGALVAMVYHSHNIAAFAIWAVPLAIFAQMGDLFESAVKRKAGAKDSGTLIPGHGGLLDRVDGLLISSVVFALFYLFWGSYL